MGKFASLVGLLALGCGSIEGGTPPMHGGEGEACYPTGTCEAAFECLNTLCATGAATSSGTCSVNRAATEWACYRPKLAYSTVWSETPNGITGDILGHGDASHLGRLIESAGGQFDFTMYAGHTATCVMSGNNPMLCIN